MPTMEESNGIPPTDRTLTCPVCFQLFDEMFKLNVHIRMEHKTGTHLLETYACFKDQWTGKAKRALVLHKQVERKLF